MHRIHVIGDGDILFLVDVPDFLGAHGVKTGHRGRHRGVVIGIIEGLGPPAAVAVGGRIVVRIPDREFILRHPPQADRQGLRRGRRHGPREGGDFAAVRGKPSEPVVGLQLDHRLFDLAAGTGIAVADGLHRSVEALREIDPDIVAADSHDHDVAAVVIHPIAALGVRDQLFLDAVIVVRINDHPFDQAVDLRQCVMHARVCADRIMNDRAGGIDDFDMPLLFD